jgi:serine/threonine protein phosphatase 1
MLGKWFKRSEEPPAHFDPVCPDESFIAFGDVHGRFDLLQRFPENKLGAQLIFLGDMIDRGDQSADVLRVLFAIPDLICLMGNHEEMMLDFIAQPQSHGGRWLRYGGLQTLDSFGVSGVAETSSGGELEYARDALVDAMGRNLLDWVSNLPKCWTSGNVAFVHAGANPTVPIDAQSNRTLLWGHKDFGKIARKDEMWIVHGHTITDKPEIKPGIISIDTGAYATGNLTAATIAPGDVSFEYV